MKPPPFDYRAPTTLAEAIGMKADTGAAASLLAGGQSLIPLLNMRLAQPDVLIDLNGVRELDFIDYSDGAVVVGAMTRQRALERSELVHQHCPLLREALLNVAHPVIRNRGTVGGSIAHAASAAELPATLVALAGSVTVAGPSGERTVPADEFFSFHFTTTIEPDEVLKSVAFPSLPAGAGWAFMEFSRRHGDFALAGVAAITHGDEVRLAFAGVGPRPLLVKSADPDAAEAAAEPAADVHASEEYRRRLVGVLARRAVRAARNREVGAGA